MRKILVLGAGRSASSLIKYLSDHSAQEQWEVQVTDFSLELAKSKVEGLQNTSASQLNVEDSEALANAVANSDVVISMVPARFHEVVAECAVDQGKHLITASYLTDKMKALDGLAKEKGIILLNECGLDPGIDHMSAMKVIDDIRSQGFELHGFESFTGGLLAPTDEDNPWEYKFTWNPRNVVLAGQGGVKFFQEGRYKYIPYHRLFRRTEIIHIPGYGYFEGYANRDSLNYREVYDLQDIKTMFRGTFRRPGFCKTWDVFVQLGATDDSYEMESVGEMTHRQFINSFLSYNPHDSVELKLAHYMKFDFESEEMNRLKWAGLFDDEPIGLEKGTPAQILEHILKKKWTLSPDDKDMIVMWHKFNYMRDGEMQEKHATLVAIGDDATHTAMSKTVGLPLGIATKLILNGEIALTGTQIPIKKEIYEPVLAELAALGFDLQED